MEGGRALEVVVVTDRAETRRFDAMLADEHWLGAGHAVGHFLRQAVKREGRWVALLTWGPAARRLKDRDAYIGWDAAKRAERLKLIVQNRRFLVPEATREPNLASQALGAAVRALPEQWKARFAYAPKLAETFTDPEAHAGTCYRAAGWAPCGMTGGFGRDAQDYYVDNDHPKKLWLKTLHRDWRERLCARVLDAEDTPARIDSPERVLPLRSEQVASLFDALSSVPDPRGRWCPFRIGSILATVVMARMCGRNSIAAIERYGKALHQKHRRMLELPIDPATGLYRAPDYMVYYKLLRAIDLDKLAAVLTDWCRARTGALPPCLAMDGKMVREIIGTLNINDAASGAAVAMAPLRMKKNKGEIKTAQRTLADMGDLQGATVTGDPLHAQKNTARQIVEQNGEYVLQVKGNQKTLYKLAQSRRDRAPFTLIESVRGRVEERQVSVQPLEPREAGIPYCLALVTVVGRFLHKTSGRQSRLERYFIASLKPDERTPSQFLAIVRGHWKGTEIGNHWHRDTIMGEDRTPSRDPNIVGAFALLNNATHALMRRSFPFQPLPETIEILQSHRARTLRLVTGPPAKG